MLSIRPESPARRAGSERFHLGDGRKLPGATLEDFWAWAFSDLRENTTRGILAEYIVGRALGIDLSVRQGWWNWDLTTSEGTRIEVKSSAFLQSWPQARLSRLTFGKLRGRAFDPETGQLGERPEYHADVYVFAVQTAPTHEDYDLLDLAQWKFWVLPRAKVERSGARSLTLNAVRSLGAVESDFEGLAAAISCLPTVQEGAS